MTLTLDKEHYEGPSDAEYLMSLWDGAEAGTSGDRYALAEAYRLATRINRSQEYALKWYDAAISAGSGDAMYRMYQFCRQGKYGIDRDMDRSMEFLVKAAEAGCEYAEIDLAWEYLTGKYVQQDFGAALEWVRKAYDGLDRLPDDERAVQRDRTVWYLCCALVADGSFESVDEAHHLLYKIKRRDSRYEFEATALLGYVHETTPHGKFWDEGNAAADYTWILRNSYSTQAIYRLADMYYEGRGVDRSYGKALALYRYAATGEPHPDESGRNIYSFNDIAAYRLGEICENGIPGVFEPDPDFARYWYAVSSYSGFRPATKKIGGTAASIPESVDEVSEGIIGFGDVRKMADPETNNYLVRKAVRSIGE